MKELITDEKKFIEDIMNDLLLMKGYSFTSIMKLISKYYINYNLENDISFTDKSILKQVLDKMEEFNIPIEQYEPYRYSDKTLRNIKNMLENNTYKFKIIKSIPIYESEYNQVMSCKSKVEKKILFTMFVIARFMDCDGWVNLTYKDLFTLANVANNTQKRQLEILRALYLDNKISLSKRVDNINLKVQLSDTNENVITTIPTPFANIGNQFIVFSNPSYIICKKCEKLVKIKSKDGRNPSYCDKCAEKILKDNWKQASLKYRNSKSS